MSGNTLFRKSSLDSISSPEQLNDYIKVSNPSIWLTLAALFILLAAVLAWGFAGNLPTTVNTEGVVSGGSVVCYTGTEDAKKISIGQKATLQKSGDSKFAGQVSGIGAIPLSAAEITMELDSDYLASKFVQGEYAVKISITPDKPDLPDGTLLDVGIETDDVRPMDFLLK
jgi:hypothetical protein